MKNPVDYLLQAVYLYKKQGGKFVREVQSAPEGMCVIVSDAQLTAYPAFAQYRNGVLLKCYQ